MNSEWSGELFGKSDQVDHYRQIGVGADNSRKGQERPRRAPGSYYEYNDVRVNALSFALMSLFRRPLPEVLRDRIMDPIGASQGWRWEGYETSWTEIDGRRIQSVPGGGHWGGGLFISATDHARFGQLILRDGVHNGQRLLPEGWMAQTVTPSATLANYGFLWWLNRGPEANPALPAGSFSAQGAGTHQIWIDPEHDAVVVLRWVAGDRAQQVLEALVRAL
jgi:CubicO group peptidase (beta-lactamase class C family)